MGMLVTLGAIVSHLTVLGIDVQGDGGMLFGMALGVFVLCSIVAFVRRKELPVIGSYF